MKKVYKLDVDWIDDYEEIQTESPSTIFETLEGARAAMKEDYDDFFNDNHKYFSWYESDRDNYNQSDFGEMNARHYDLDDYFRFHCTWTIQELIVKC